MLVYLLINGALYKDRTIKSLVSGFKELLGLNLQIYNVQGKGFTDGIPKATSESVCLLYGNLRDHHTEVKSNEITPNYELVKFLDSFSGKKFWITKHDSDLDHYPEDLIMGKKTRENPGERDGTYSSLLDLFDGLIWFGEDLPGERQWEDFPIPVKVHWSEDYVRFKREVLNVSVAELKTKFTKRIEYAHCVPTSSIPLGRVAVKVQRPYAIGLVGTLYNNRRFVQENLRLHNIEHAPFEKYEKVVRRANSLVGHLSRAGIRNGRVKNLQRSIRYTSQQFLYLQSRLAWVDPGYFGYLVRKYFEASIAGAALIGQTNHGIENKGFVGNQNLLVSKGTDLLDLLEISEAQRQRLVSNSLDMIQELHTGRARATQIFDAICDSSSSYVYTFRESRFLRVS